MNFPCFSLICSCSLLLVKFIKDVETCVIRNDVKVRLQLYLRRCVIAGTCQHGTDIWHSSSEWSCCSSLLNRHRMYTDVSCSFLQSYCVHPTPLRSNALLRVHFFCCFVDFFCVWWRGPLCCTCPPWICRLPRFAILLRERSLCIFAHHFILYPCYLSRDFSPTQFCTCCCRRHTVGHIMMTK